MRHFLEARIPPDHLLDPAPRFLQVIGDDASDDQSLADLGELQTPETAGADDFLANVIQLVAEPLGRVHEIGGCEIVELVHEFLVEVQRDCAQDVAWVGDLHLAASAYAEEGRLDEMLEDELVPDDCIAGGFLLRWRGFDAEAFEDGGPAGSLVVARLLFRRGGPGVGGAGRGREPEDDLGSREAGGGGLGEGGRWRKFEHDLGRRGAGRGGGGSDDAGMLDGGRHDSGRHAERFGAERFDVVGKTARCWLYSLAEEMKSWWRIWMEACDVADLC